MYKKFFNCLVPNIVELLITIALLLFLGSTSSIQAAATSYGSDIVSASVPTPEHPTWGKLVVSGNTVSCYYALGTAAPKIWRPLGTPQTINFINDPLLVGICVASYNNAAVTAGTIDNFSISPAPSYRLADFDIGAPELMGYANLVRGVWNIAGSGFDVGGTSDQCNFQSWLVWGDCTVICRITSLSAGKSFEKIGIMVRDGFNSGSDYAMFSARNGDGINFQYRPSFNNNPDITEFVAPPAPGVKSGVAIGYGLTGGTAYTVRP
jgi:hypothetical protein